MKFLDFLKYLKDYWVILCFLIYLILSFSSTQITIRNHAERIQTLEKYRADETLLLTDIQARLASIETSLIFIKDRLK